METKPLFVRKNCKWKYKSVILLLVFILIMGIQVNAEESQESFALSANCVLKDKKTISYKATLPGTPMSDDGKVYLYALQPYEYSVPVTAIPLAEKELSNNPSFEIALNDNTGGTRLYNKFALVVKQSGQNVMIAVPQYITNPEILAQFTRPRLNRSFKSVQGVDFANLLVSGNIMGVMYGGNYTTIQVLNEGNDQSMTNPYARVDMKAADSHPIKARYYMLNASDPQGITKLVNELTQCAAYTNIENFIIGNEVNNRSWNYMSWTDWPTYVREYVQEFRVAYNAIKSQNANANVYICIDQYWDVNQTPDNKEYYETMDAKDFILMFNDQMAKEGNVDWNVAQHPYLTPLTYAKFWDMSDCPKGDYREELVKSGKYVTFQNLSVLTDFLQSPILLNTSGKARDVILSEIGVTNEQGEEVQAASMCASYVAAKDNPFVSEIIYLLTYNDPKMDTRLSGQSQLVYDSMGGANGQVYEEWAKAYIGINDWSEILK